MVKLLRVLATIIAIVLLIYGLMRLLGSVPILGAVLGWWTLDGEVGEQMMAGVAKVRTFLADNRGFIPLGLAGYFATSMVMGLALVAGALAWLFKRRLAGLVGVGAYILIWAAMFLNYGVTDATMKLLTLASTAGAWVVLYLAWRAEQRGR